MCMFPVFFVIGVVVFAVWLSRTKLGYKPILGGLALLIVSFCLGLSWDRHARFLIFHWNSQRYHDYVAKTVPTLPKKEGRTNLVRGTIPGFGVYDGYIERSGDNYVLWIQTHSGMSLDTTAFSPQPLKDKSMRHLRQDDLGHWYIEKRD